MNVWEETWTAEDGHRTTDSNGASVWNSPSVRTPSSRADFHFHHVSESERDNARAQLAAAAPEMARVLLLLWKADGPVSVGLIREALRNAGVIPSFEEEAAALERHGEEP